MQAFSCARLSTLFEGAPYCGINTIYLPAARFWCHYHHHHHYYRFETRHLPDLDLPLCDLSHDQPTSLNLNNNNNNTNTTAKPLCPPHFWSTCGRPDSQPLFPPLNPLLLCAPSVLGRLPPFSTGSAIDNPAPGGSATLGKYLSGHVANITPRRHLHPPHLPVTG